MANYSTSSSEDEDEDDEKINLNIEDDDDDERSLIQTLKKNRKEFGSGCSKPMLKL